jgi:hypothetical protein
VLAVLNIVAAGVICALLLRDLLLFGTAWMDKVEGGSPASWATVVGVVTLPCLWLIWLGVGLWRFDRAAWVLQMGLGVLTVPLFGVGLVPLLVLSRRSSRWLFGIGPDAVLAEIDAREEVPLEELARKFGVGPGVIAQLLEQAIARGAFLGAWDRTEGVLYSVDTVVTRTTLQRCPRCGGAIQARGNLARCPYCAAEFAHLTGLDFPLPAPVGLAVIRALDNLLCYTLAFVALFWSLIMARWNLQGRDPERVLLAWFLCSALPLALSVAYYRVGHQLEQGRRSGWLAQLVLLPMALPYLLRRRIRVLFASGLEPLRARLQQSGQLEMAEVATLLGVDRRHAEETAVYLTATGALDSVLDWYDHRLIHRDHPGADGRTDCRHCGAPLRVGGWCAFCGTADRPAPREVPADPSTAPRQKRALAPIALGVCATVVLLLSAGSALRQRSSQEAPSSEATVSAGGSSGPLEPVRDYDPARKETFMGAGIHFLGFTEEGDQLLSGEGNGLFVWDLATRRRQLRTPRGWEYAGVQWVGLLPGTQELLVKPYYRAVLRGSTRDWHLRSKLDLEALHKSLGEAHLAAAVVDANGHPLFALVSKGVLHLYDLQDERLLHSLPLDSDMARQVVFDRTGTRVAVAPLEGPTKAVVWEVATGSTLFSWKEEKPAPGGFNPLITALGLSRDGTMLVTVDLGDLDLWDVTTRRHLRHIPGVSVGGPVVFSEDGRFFAVSSQAPGEEDTGQEGVRVFAADGTGPLHSFEGHTDRVTALAFNADGSLLVSGDASGKVKFWDLDPPDTDPANPASKP